MKNEVNEMIANGSIKNVMSGPTPDNFITLSVKDPESAKLITYERLEEMARTGYATSDEIQLLSRAILKMARGYR